MTSHLLPDVDWADPSPPEHWGIGPALVISIISGGDWSVPFKVFAADGVTPLDVRNPVIEMRRDRSTDAQFLAHFDTAGQSNGLITVLGPGDWVLSMTATDTRALPSGRGFFDCFGSVDGVLTPIASGVVIVRPRVTLDPGSGISVLPPPVVPAPPPITIESTPAVINIRFRGGDTYLLDLTVDESGAPADLSGITDVDAEVTTTEGAHLVNFSATITGNVIRLALNPDQTAVLPATCSWFCKVTGVRGTITIAVGQVNVTP